MREILENMLATLKKVCVNRMEYITTRGDFSKKKSPLVDGD